MVSNSDKAGKNQVELVRNLLAYIGSKKKWYLVHVSLQKYRQHLTYMVVVFPALRDIKKIYQKHHI